MVCRWLFYIEEGATMLVAVCALFILPDFPHNTRWLTPEERALAMSRLENDGHDRADTKERTSMQGLWGFVAAYIAQLLGQSFFAHFPTLSATMGYNTTITLLLCAPPWVLSTIGSFALSRWEN
jgi:hypothetical protein